MSENLKLVTWALNEIGADLPLITPPSKSDGLVLPKTAATNSQNSNSYIRDEIYGKNRVEVMKNSRPLSPLFVDTNLGNCDNEFENVNADFHVQSSAVIINKEVFEEMGDENSENYVPTSFMCFADSKNLEDIKRFEHTEAKSSLGISEYLLKFYQINSMGNNPSIIYCTT